MDTGVPRLEGRGRPSVHVAFPPRGSGPRVGGSHLL